jgi:hypothetical protein
LPLEGLEGVKATNAEEADCHDDVVQADRIVAEGGSTQTYEKDPDLVLRQHAELGSIEDMKELRKNEAERAKQIRDSKGDSC